MPPARHSRKSLRRFSPLQVNSVSESSDCSAWKAQALCAARQAQATYGLSVVQASGLSVRARASDAPLDSCLFCWAVRHQYTQCEQGALHCAQCLDDVSL